MRFLVDQDVWKVTFDLLRAWKHDVVSARELGMARSSDKELLLRAAKEKGCSLRGTKVLGLLHFLGTLRRQV
jgi:hypothetical protein